MSLKQLLGTGLLLLVLSAGAVAATQLNDVGVSTQGNTTVVSIQTSGSFTHTEYKPTEDLLLVDLAGVSASTWKEKAHVTSLPGVTAYHVMGYRGANGAEVARIGISIVPGSDVHFSDNPNSLQVKITPKQSASKSAPLLAEKSVQAKVDENTLPSASSVAPVKTVQKPVEATLRPTTIVPASEVKPRPVSGTATVEDVSVVRGDESLDIEISGSAPITAKASKFSSPSRIVIDIANSLPAKNKTIQVNSDDVKAVRMGRFQDVPPTTRVVVDLMSAHDFEMQNEGNKVTVKLRMTEVSPAKLTPKRPEVSNTVVDAKNVQPVKTLEPKAAVVPVSLTTAPAVTNKPEPKGAAESDAQSFVVVEPSYTPKPEVAQAQADPKALAQAAAKVIEASSQSQATVNLATPVSAALQAPAANPAQQQAAQAAAPQVARSTRYTGEPISVNLKDVDLKDFFRLIHEISGLNIVLDPNVHGTLTLVLDDVPWDQALDIVLANNGLDRKLDGNILRIATVDTLRREADAQRAKNEAEALSVPKTTLTHFLSYAKANDVVPTVKRFLSQRGDVIADVRTNALIIQDIPSVLPEVQKLLAQLDRKTQEVEIEARVIAATRSFARDIGTQLGFGWGNGVTTVGGTGAVGSTPTTVGYINPPPYVLTNPITTTGGTTATQSSIPLFSNLPATGPTSGLGITNVVGNYRLDAVLTLAESRGLLKVLSRPRIVTQNNIQAIVRQGVRVPVVTAAQLGGPPTTTYVEAFLRLTVTPQITVENTIFLNIDVENTTPDFGRQINNNPTLITQQATTSVLVNDGGTVVIGGVIQTQNSVNVTQVPLLGDIPALGNLFKRRAVSTSTQELLFFVTPKIVQT